MKIKYKNIIHSVVTTNDSEIITSVVDDNSSFKFSKVSNNLYKNQGINNADFYRAEDKKHIYIFSNGKSFVFDKMDERHDYGDDIEESSDIQLLRAPMPGNVVKILVSKGDKVNEGSPLMLIEAMKMEMTLYSSLNGEVTEINIDQGRQLEADEILMRIEKIN